MKLISIKRNHDLQSQNVNELGKQANTSTQIMEYMRLVMQDLEQRLHRELTENQDSDLKKNQF